jgi:hypothetical protein
MLQVFYLYIAYIAVAIHIYCKRVFQMFHLFQTYVTANSSCCKCFMSRRGKRVLVEAVLTCVREARRARIVPTERRVIEPTNLYKLK